MTPFLLLLRFPSAFVLFASVLRILFFPLLHFRAPFAVPLACFQLFPFRFCFLACVVVFLLHCRSAGFLSSSVVPCFSCPAFMVASCSCVGFPLLLSRVFYPALVPLLQGCLSGCVRLLCRSLRLGVLLKAGGDCCFFRSPSGVYALSVLYFAEFALLFRSSAITSSSGRVMSFLRLFSPSLVVFYCSPGSFFARLASFIFLLFIEFPCLLPAAFLTVLSLHSALLKFLSSCLFLALFYCVSLYSASISFCFAGLSVFTCGSPDVCFILVLPSCVIYPPFPIISKQLGYSGRSFGVRIRLSVVPNFFCVHQCPTVTVGFTFSFFRFSF